MAINIKQMKMIDLAKRVKSIWEPKIVNNSGSISAVAKNIVLIP